MEIDDINYTTKPLLSEQKPSNNTNLITTWCNIVKHPWYTCRQRDISHIVEASELWRFDAVAFIVAPVHRILLIRERVALPLHYSYLIHADVVVTYCLLWISRNRLSDVESLLCARRCNNGSNERKLTSKNEFRTCRIFRVSIVVDTVKSYKVAK